MSEQDIPEIFDTENVIVCQYDKVKKLLRNCLGEILLNEVKGLENNIALKYTG